jgi:hypothetical protein
MEELPIGGLDIWHDRQICSRNLSKVKWNKIITICQVDIRKIHYAQSAVRNVG